ncbi:FAD-dependent monooxygenase [Nonomuraea sp. NPDC046570]|uniref:FAD-dependent monooxygenase n=1 Tax=Nonomuraea sp. NPDC046570 TaxID=3155255 RepID=UPI0034011297
MGDRTLVCLGGGPAGLFLARLLRRADPSWHVTVYERNTSDATFGFGIGLADRLLDELAERDPGTHRRILGAGVVGHGMSLRHRGTDLRWGPRGGLAVSRAELLRILREQALEAGVTLKYGTPADVRSVDATVIVGADGANSSTRAALGEELGVTESLGRAKYIWLGAEIDLAGMTFSLVADEHGAWASHAYPYAPGLATFLVETDEDTWRRAGLDQADPPLNDEGSDLLGIRHLERLFRDDLGGRPLLGNRSRWANFRNVRCDRWSAGNVVLVGDAAHTAHFSIGSGTTMAMEDSLSLVRHLVAAADPPEAFARYEAERRPPVEHLQSRAAASQTWWETFGERMDGDPHQVAFQYLTRTGALSYDRLRGADPRLAREVAGWFAGSAAARSGADPLCAPITIAGTRLATRVVVTRPPAPAGSADARDLDLARFGGLALAGAGLVVIDLDGMADGLDWDAWAELARFIAARTDAVPGVRIAPDPMLAKAAAQAGFGYVEFSSPPSDLKAATDAAGTALRAVTVPAGLAKDLESFRASGVDVIRLESPGPPDLTLAALAEEIRGRTGLATLAGDGSAGTERLRTAVVAGQVDLAECWPIVPAGI